MTLDEIIKFLIAIKEVEDEELKDCALESLIERLEEEKESLEDKDN